MEESPVDGTVFQGKSGGAWPSIPGTYYWQAWANYMEGPPAWRVVHLISPVFTFTVTAPAPAPPPAETRPTITLSESYAAVKEIVRKETGESARHLSDKCRRTGASEATCKASWFTAVHLSSSTLLYTGSFKLWREPEGNYFSFSGLRERVGCARRFGAKHCASKVHWR